MAARKRLLFSVAIMMVLYAYSDTVTLKKERSRRNLTEIIVSMFNERIKKSMTIAKSTQRSVKHHCGTDEDCRIRRRLRILLGQIHRRYFDNGQDGRYRGRYGTNGRYGGRYGSKRYRASVRYSKAEK